MKELSKNSKFIYPDVAPTDIIGRPEYYLFRSDNFTLRANAMSIKQTAPEYYLNFGFKYANRFLNEVSPELTETGRNWVIETTEILQLDIENKLKEDPDIEFLKDKFEDFVFWTHPAAYLKTGFFSLPARDIVKIVSAIDANDLFRFEFK